MLPNYLKYLEGRAKMGGLCLYGMIILISILKSMVWGCELD